MPLSKSMVPRDDFMDEESSRKLVKLPLSELVALADKVRKEEAGSKVELCSIMNAKSGLCGEDCRFCAQASRHSTGAAVYPLKSRAEMVGAAKRARDIGAERFDIVTSGKALSKDEVREVADAVSQIVSKIGIKMCASLGKLDEEDLTLLKKAGLTRYHHNIETSPRFFPRIVTTHSFEDRLKTIRAAKRAGLEVCSGGIIGLGESWDDRLDMAFILRELGADSVPINILVPIKGTPLEDAHTLSSDEVIRTIAIFRIILRDKIIKVAAGRESVLKDSQVLAFMAGANGMLIGGYLTIKGRSVEEDRRLVREVEEAWKG